jgi:ribosomal protein S18 acetylase RimI-like enzyme
MIKLEPRRATADDMPAVAALHRLSFFHAMPHMPVLHTPDEDLAFYLNVVLPRAEIWIIEQNGRVAGFIAFREGQIDHLYVHPEHMGRGLGSLLLKLAMAREIGNEVRLWTFQCNTNAQRFYERHGFRVERDTDGADNEESQPDLLYVWRRPDAAANSNEGRGASV